MYLLRLLLFIVLILLTIKLIARAFGIFSMVQRFFRSHAKPTSHQNHSMVQCTTCGTYVAEQDAYIANGKPYCSKQHAENVN